VRAARGALYHTQVLMSREFMTDWLVKQPTGLESISHALVKLPAQFVYDLLIFPLFEAHLARTTSGSLLGVVVVVAVVFVWCLMVFTVCRSGEADGNGGEPRLL
jgi:hypothetical protein